MPRRETFFLFLLVCYFVLFHHFLLGPSAHARGEGAAEGGNAAGHGQGHQGRC